MKQLIICLVLIVLAGCAGKSTSTDDGLRKGDVLLKLGDANIQTVIYQGTSGDGKPYFKYPDVNFIQVLMSVSPEAYAEVRKELGAQVFSYELRKYDTNNDSLITVEEFTAMLTEFTEEDMAKFSSNLRKALREASTGK